MPSLSLPLHRCFFFGLRKRSSLILMVLRNYLFTSPWLLQLRLSLSPPSTPNPFLSPSPDPPQLPSYLLPSPSNSTLKTLPSLEFGHEITEKVRIVCIFCFDLKLLISIPLIIIEYFIMLMRIEIRFDSKILFWWWDFRDSMDRGRTYDVLARFHLRCITNKIIKVCSLFSNLSL